MSTLAATASRRSDSCERIYVVVLTGPRITAGSLAPPAGVVPVYCRSLDELRDRASRLAPICAIVDAGAGDGAELARAVSSATHGHALVIGLGSRPGSALVDFAIPDGADSAAQLAGALRYAVGRDVRRRSRVPCDGRAVVRLDGDRSLDVPIVDLGEEGVRVRALPGLPEDGATVSMLLRLPGDREVSVRAALVRRGDDEDGTAAYAFVEIGRRSRAGLRAFLVRAHSSAGAGAPGELDQPAGRRAEPTREPRRGGRAIIGESPSLRRCLAAIDRVAATDVSVLVLGETGTGKELAARALHDGSPRAGGPFVAVNCAALPENLVESELFGHEPGAFTGASRRKIGRIEQSSGGTLFLDEIGDLPPMAQAKLLRALQERVIERVGGNEPIKVDFRLVAATNQDLEAGVAQKAFRRDLFYRLNVVALHLPALRDRLDDVPSLADHFMRRTMERLGKQGIRLNEHARAQMLRYPWPGNVRELENLCTRVVALAPSGALLGPEHLGLMVSDELPHSPLPSTDLRDILDFCEREIVKRMLERHGGNRTRSAQALGISRQALQQKLARFRTATGDAGGDGAAEEPPGGE